MNKKLKIISNSEIIITQNVTKRYSSEKEFNDFLIKAIDSYRRDLVLATNANTKKPARPVDIYNVIKMYVPLKYTTIIDASGKELNEFFIQDFNNPYGLYKPLDVKRLVVEICEIYETTSIKSAIEDVNIRLANLNPKRTKFEPLNLPPKHIVLYKNSVVNLKTMEYSYDIKQFGDYDFISMSEFNIKTKDEVNPIKYEIVQRIMNDWSENDPEKLLFLQQLAFAALDGNGRKNFIILIGSGGNGKSTFLTILENLAGKSYTAKLNLQDYADDNKFTSINETTKLILGHDLATNAKLSNTLISRFKEFVTEEAFLVNVKYKDDRFVVTPGLKIQSTNTLLDIFENTDAMRRRLKLFNWTNKNFSQLTTENKFNLDKFVGTSFDKTIDHEFYEAFIAYIFEHVEYFNEFVTVQSMVEATNNMINEADAVYNFLEWFVDEELNQFKYFPAPILYELYKEWHWQNNPKGSPLKSRAFIERLKPNLIKFNMRFSDNRARLTEFSLLNFNFNYISQNYMDNRNNFNKKTKFNYIISDKELSQKDIDNFKIHEKLTIDELTVKELIILDYLIEKGNTEAILLKNS